MDNKFKKTILKVDNVILSAMESDRTLYNSLLAEGVKTSLVGDVRKVRNLRGAVTDGANIGMVMEKDLQLNANAEIISNLPNEIL